VDTGIVRDVTEDAKARGFDLARMWPALRDAATVDGRQYSVPTNCSPSAIFYNKDVFDRLGVPYPKGDWTWEEFLATARRLTVPRANGRGYSSFGVMGITLNECIWQAGGAYYTPDGLRCVLDSPEALEGARFYSDLQHKYHVMPTSAEESAMSSTGGWGTGALNFFMSGHIGMIVSGRFAVLNWRQTPGLRVGVAPLPHHRVHANRLFWRSTAVNRKGPNAEAALLFLEFLTSANYARSINTSGDGISAMPQYDRTAAYLHDAAHPDETDNALWLHEMKYTRDVEVSPYINASEAARLIENHNSLLRTGDETPEAAMRNAAREINAVIRKIIARDPIIRARYERRNTR
jgi:multiple sugar transport system substrate-binding protein